MAEPQAQSPPQQTPVAGSQEKVKSPPGSNRGSVANAIRSDTPLVLQQGYVSVVDDEDGTAPDFIYGGPFIKQVKPSMFLDTTTPINLPLQGTFRRSYAYFSLKERLPIILTKVIDYCSREAGTIKSTIGASDDDIRKYVEYVSKLKSELVTNKNYTDFTVPSPECRKWNEWISNADPKNYFGYIWAFTECYVYRRLREASEIIPGLYKFDPFKEAKEQGFKGNLEPMCVVADRMMESMLNKSEKAKRKEDFGTLLKISLWANRCDLSLSAGDHVAMEIAPPPPPPPKPPPPGAPIPPPPKGKKGKKGGAPPAPLDPGYLDPFVMVLNFKERLIVDDSGKAFENLTTKGDKMRTAIENPERELAPASAEGELPGPVEEQPKIPCPAKSTIPSAVFFDIVCDNAGFELFADLCLAHFLIAQGMVHKVRFHVKKYPWFVSDVTVQDFYWVIEQCKTANFAKEVELKPMPGQPAPAEGEGAGTKSITSGNLQQLGDAWTNYLSEGQFIVMCDDYWTYPHVYRDMKRIEPNMYRKLQFAVMILFKGDLNYRKLVGERNCVNTVGLEPSMQGFIPAPILAARTVKSELICGMPKGRYELLNNIDDKWMIKGDYGVIQFCAKAEPFKVSDRPCLDYGVTCFGTGCPVHTDL